MPDAERQNSVRGFAMSNYVLKYKRDERVKYISHLDFIRLFHRTVRRAGVNFVYSQGFNPHPVMTVAMPLSVGVTSESEYLKVGFLDELKMSEIKKRINSAFPPGFEVTEITKVQGKEMDFSKITKAEYIVEIELSDDSDIDIDKFLENAEIKVMKKSKSGIKESDIKPYIYGIEYIGKKERVVTLKMCLACGSVYNLKPDTVADAFSKYLDLKIEFISVHRNKLIFEEDK